MPKTEITSKNLYETRNTSDVFSRSVVMGLLRILNSLLSYTLVWNDEDGGILNVTVPFFFDFGGGSITSEKFIQDNYTNWTDEECTSMGIKKMNGDFKVIPFGVITLESTNIESSNISNRFVMGQYQKKVGDEMKSYVSFLYSIPLSMTFGVTIVCDNVNTMWKIEQAYREYFYKNKTFRFNYKGAVCPARVGFPESITENKTATYQMGNATGDGYDIKLNFNLTCETYQPVFDKYSEMEADNTIKNVGINITVNNKGDSIVKEDGFIRVDKKINDLNIVTEQDILLEWKFLYNNSDLTSVDILYQEEGSDVFYPIESNVENHNCYHLSFDNDFIDSNVILDMIVENSDDAIIVNPPKIKFYADPETNIINSGTCVIVDKGFILTERPYINALLDYYDSKLKLHETEFKINILNNAVNEEDPIDMKGFVYDCEEVNYKKIKVYVRDHNNPDIMDCFQDEDSWIYVF